MSNEAVRGTVIPVNLSVYYTFSLKTLQESIRLFGGEGPPDTASGDDSPNLPLRALDPSKIEELGPEETELLRVLLTYSHEQFHLRHLTASPVGLLLYMLGGRKILYTFDALRRWGERIGASPDSSIKLPLWTHHIDDEEIKDAEHAWEVFDTFERLFMDALEGVTLLEAAGGVLRPMMEEVEKIISGALHLHDSYPDIDLQGNYDQLVNPTVKDTRLTGRAVLEGLARMTEFMTLTDLSIPADTINEILPEKQHGVYVQTLGFAVNLLKVTPPTSWVIVAKLSDWAMQAPVLPFLLRGRKSVTVLELLPAWRYVLLVIRFNRAGFTVEDLLVREREVAAQIFGGLGWADPWEVANSILETNAPSPTSTLTRHYWENLRLGAELRLSQPSVLCFPDFGDKGYKLQALYNIFSDGIAQRVGARLTEDVQMWSLLGNLVTDATIQALLTEQDLTLAFKFAKIVSDFTGGTPRPGTLLGNSLKKCVGPLAAKKVLETVGWT